MNGKADAKHVEQQAEEVRRQIYLAKRAKVYLSGAIRDLEQGEIMGVVQTQLEIARNLIDEVLKISEKG